MASGAWLARGPVRRAVAAWGETRSRVVPCAGVVDGHVWKHTKSPIAPSSQPVALADLYANAMAPNTYASSSVPRARTPQLWSSTLSASTRATFVRRTLAQIHAGHGLRAAVIAAAPPTAHIYGQEGAERREELQCVFLLYVLSQKQLPFDHVAELWYPNGAMDESLHHVPKDAAPALRRLQRAALYRYFHAQLHAMRFHAAACTLHDPRLRPAQPKHLLRLLLERTKHVAPARALCDDPRQSVRAALDEACRAFTTHTRSALSAALFQSMLYQLTALSMHTTLLQWTSLAPHVEHGISDTRGLTRIARQLCQRGAYADAFAYVHALPVPWRTHGMYTALLKAYADAWLDVDGSLASKNGSPSAVLWDELCTVPHLAPPPIEAYLARLASHADDGRARHALRDVRLLRARTPTAAQYTRAATLLLRALMAAGRWSLAMRIARRYVAQVGVPAEAVAWLNTMVTSLVSAPLPLSLSHADRSALLSSLYRALLPSGTPAPAQPPGRLPCLLAGTDRLASFVDAIAAFAHTCHVRPDRTTFLLLVRAATQWDERLDSQALWHMARLALPDTHVPGSTPARTPPFPDVLLRDLATAFARRADYRSARNAHFLARQAKRRIQAPRCFLPPHRT